MSKQVAFRKRTHATCLFPGCEKPINGEHNVMCRRHRKHDEGRLVRFHDNEQTGEVCA